MVYISIHKQYQWQEAIHVVHIDILAGVYSNIHDN